jgi:hypothetical protein
VPITINLGSAQVVNFAATFTVVAPSGAPAVTAKLTYQAATPPGAPQLTDDGVTGSFAIGYVSDITPPLTGTVVIGNLGVPIPEGASGTYEVRVLNVSALDPDFNDLAISGQNGAITVAGGPTGPTLSAGMVTGEQGQTASVPITISLGTAQVVNFAATFTVVPQSGAPPITAKLTYQAATPPGAPQLTDDGVTGSFAIGYVSDITPPLTGMLVIGNLGVPIPAGATGSYQVQVLNVSALDPDFNDLDISGQAGLITLGGPMPTETIPLPPTFTPTPTETRPPTATQTERPTSTNTVPPTVTRTPTATQTRTATTGAAPVEDDDGGCQISARGNGGTAWLLLIPAVVLLVRRRTHR